MPALDKRQFEKMVRKAGFSIEYGTKHPYIVAPDGDTLVFAISHKKGGKDYIKPYYVKTIQEFIQSKGGSL